MFGDCLVVNVFRAAGHQHPFSTTWHSRTFLDAFSLFVAGGMASIRLQLGCRCPLDLPHVRSLSTVVCLHLAAQSLNAHRMKDWGCRLWSTLASRCLMITSRMALKHSERVCRCLASWSIIYCDVKHLEWWHSERTFVHKQNRRQRRQKNRNGTSSASKK